MKSEKALRAAIAEVKGMVTAWAGRGKPTVGNLTEIPAFSSSYGPAGHWQSSKEMTPRSSQAHRLSLESPRLGQTDLDMLLPSPQYSHSQSLLTWPHSARARRGSGASSELFLLARTGFPGSREWLQQEWGCSLTLRWLRIKRHHHLGPHAPPSCQRGHAVL